VPDVLALPALTVGSGDDGIVCGDALRDNVAGATDDDGAVVDADAGAGRCGRCDRAAQHTQRHARHTSQHNTLTQLAAAAATAAATACIDVCMPRSALGAGEFGAVRIDVLDGGGGGGGVLVLAAMGESTRYAAT
jgi:hypothetical protein